MQEGQDILTRTIRRQHARLQRPAIRPRIVSVGTANPPRKYSQAEVLAFFQETDPKICQLFQNSHIESRYLYLPEPIAGKIREESSQQLQEKHLQGVMEIGPQAIDRCLGPLGLEPKDIDFFCCLSSTGFVCPSLTARLTEAMHFRENVCRIDILGMGCNGAVNGLTMARSFCGANPGKNALMLCVEICSAAYVYRRNMGTAVVNSLFGDGAAAIMVRQSDGDSWQQGPIVVDVESHIVPECLMAMRYDLDRGKLSFHLDREIPYQIGLNVEKPINRLLGRWKLKRRHIDHWIVHSGGKKVIDSVEYSLGLSDHDLRHTINVLRNYGNLSSGSILFSYQELMRENVVNEGDLGVVIAMGPGTSIETALLMW